MIATTDIIGLVLVYIICCYGAFGVVLFTDWMQPRWYWRLGVFLPVVNALICVCTLLKWIGWVISEIVKWIIYGA